MPPATLETDSALAIPSQHFANVSRERTQADTDIAVYTRCPLCDRVESVSGLRCSLCRSILRRCYDCGSYDIEAQKCRALGGAAIEIDDAEDPIEDSPSYLCQRYWPKAKGKGFALTMTDSAQVI